MQLQNGIANWAQVNLGGPQPAASRGAATPTTPKGKRLDASRGVKVEPVGRDEVMANEK